MEHICSVCQAKQERITHVEIVRAKNAWLIALIQTRLAEAKPTVPKLHASFSNKQDLRTVTAALQALNEGLLACNLPEKSINLMARFLAHAEGTSSTQAFWIKYEIVISGIAQMKP